MFNVSIESIIIETVVYIFVSLIVKLLLNDEDVKSIRRMLLIGYLIFASLFVSLKVFLVVSVVVIFIAIGVRKILEY